MNRPMEIIKTAHGTSYRLPVVDGKRVITDEYLKAVTAGWDTAGFIRAIKEAKR